MIHGVCDEQYNGWTNRESWALHLWLSSDELLYRQAVHYACAGTFKEFVEDDLWPRLPHAADGLMMMRDVGSLWRVNWEDVAGAFTEAPAQQSRA